MLETVRGAMPALAIEMVPLAAASGRVLAREVVADRDYPPVNRSIRDGYAVRAADAQGALRVIGEVRAGESFAGLVGPGEAVEIMTGAPVPAGADAVVMIEHVRREEMRSICCAPSRPVGPGDFHQLFGVLRCLLEAR